MSACIDIAVTRLRSTSKIPSLESFFRLHSLRPTLNLHVGLDVTPGRGFAVNSKKTSNIDDTLDNVAEFDTNL